MFVLYTWPSWPQLIEYNFWDLLLYFDTFGHVFMPCMVKCQRLTNRLLNVWNCKWPLLPSIHHMRNMRDYFLTILCTCLKNSLNYIYVNMNFDFSSLLYICRTLKISPFLFSVGIYAFLLVTSCQIIDRRPTPHISPDCRPIVDWLKKKCSN